VAGKTVNYLFDDLFTDYIELKAETLSSTCFLGNGKGGFTAQPLPKALQMAPIMCWTQAKHPNGQNLWLAGGNFYDVMPYEGRYDAQPISLLTLDGKKNLVSLPPYDFSRLNCQVRDIKWMGDILLIAANNDSLLFFKKKGKDH
jgi:hypothetical protein